MIRLLARLALALASLAWAVLALRLTGSAKRLQEELMWLLSDLQGVLFVAAVALMVVLAVMVAG